jgi:hypothetical protein
MKDKKVKKKITKNKDGFWDTSDLYKSGKSPFDLEYIKTEAFGATKIVLVYKAKSSGKIIKYRVL